MSAIEVRPDAPEPLPLGEENVRADVDGWGPVLVVAGLVVVLMLVVSLMG